ncbi:MAG: M20/M25/M40 family metallo-hydrolase [Pyrinomonadaceae bacterium]
MRRNFIAFLVLLSLMLSQSTAVFALSGNSSKAAVTITAEEKKMAEAITADRLKDYLSFIASDAMGGRDTPSAGLDITAQFIAMNLKHWGFKPAGDNGTFFQGMKLKKESVNWSKLEIDGKTYTSGEDFFRLTGGQIENSPLVFVGDGWTVKSKGIDAYKGIDAKGKVVVVYSAESGRGVGPARPKGVSQDDLKGENGVDWADPAKNAEIQGAKGIILIANDGTLGRWNLFKRFLGGGRPTVEGLGGNDSGPALPTLLVNQMIGAALFEGAEMSYKESASTDLSAKLMYEEKLEVENMHAQNVVAIWEGSDPKLKNEMVAIGAHYDHVGTNQNAQGDDKIFNGADDDGSGTVGVLSIAEALAKAPKRPKRSVLFVWHCGEEKGLWGSEYFNKFPTVDIKNVVAQLNIDMIGRSRMPDNKDERDKDLSGPNEVYVIGSEMMSSTLGAVTRETNAGYKNMEYNLKYDDPKDTNRFFFRSDHFNYALNGIPIVFWFTGVHRDYHQASDEVDKIDFNKMETIARTIFLTLWEVSSLDKRPAIDKELPPELRSRN